MTRERYMIKILQASEEGKRIEQTELDSPLIWKPFAGKWNWEKYSFRIAPEPKKEGRWERVEIVKSTGVYTLSKAILDIVTIDALPCIPGFGGIEYRSPFDEKVIIRSMVPLMFSPDPNSDLHFSVGIEPDDRPGIPVAAWFWQEEQ